MPLKRLQLVLERSASKRLSCSMTIATNTKSMKKVRRRLDTLTTLMQVGTADFGRLMAVLPTRRVTAWLKIACLTTVFTRETSSTLNVKPLLMHGKQKLQLSKSNARSSKRVPA